MSEHSLTRRTLLKGAAGGAVALGGGALPAWSRPVSRATRLRRPDSLPFPHLPAGHPSMPEIRHIVVVMMENHSFDNILGMAGHEIPALRGLDGLTVRGGKLRNFNRDASGRRVYAKHASTPCQLHAKPSQAWDASHTSYNGGRNDGFVLASGDDAMWFWDKRDLPGTYSLARHFPIGERYFCSTLAQTYPNRRFFFAGTASGSIDDKAYALVTPAANGTIFDRLDAHRISYVSYYQDLASWLILPNVRNNATQVAKARRMDRFFSDAAAGRLPQFSVLDPNYQTTSEENPQDVQVGEQFVAQVARAILHSPNWRHTALFLTYDEHGGYYDHVPPPRAIAPDAIKPQTYPAQNAPGSYDRYGFRVPLIVVSPWARKNYVSRIVQDHTSITAFVERKWNLPAMTFRDANAQPMTDYFDFTRPAFATPPAITAAPALHPGLVRCKAAGYNPPLPPGVS
ncbi:MAG: phospholipase [Solirubrobacteraceae bacterium]|nr:phospholipase [Solirubrobacteraceae bacterium]